MKKFHVFFATAVLVICALASCSKTKNHDVATTDDQNPIAESWIVDKEGENGIAMYVITFRIKQSHFTLDIGEHIKDAMNEITFDVPVDKEYYDSLSAGDVINNDFRVGSLIMHGSFGNWKVTVDQKEVRYQQEAAT